MRKVGALIFPGFELLDVFGPMEFFGIRTNDFAVHLIAETAGAVPSNQGPSAQADVALEAATEFDVILVPGGYGTRREVGNPRLLDWIAHSAQTAEYTLGVCTGSALMAKAGVLDGRRATTNKAAFAWVEAQGPRVEWVKQARWVEDGRVFTSSGVSAGMDMTLAAIAAMLGREEAEEVARWCEYSWHDDKDWDPFARIHGLV